MRSNKFGARCYGHLGSLSSGARDVDGGIALAECSFAASRPSINGEQSKSGIPSRRKVRSSSMPRESANVNPCRLRHTRLDALAVATICRVSPTHAPINFPSRPIDTSVICIGCVIRSNLSTSDVCNLNVSDLSKYRANDGDGCESARSGQVVDFGRPRRPRSAAIPPPIADSTAGGG